MSIHMMREIEGLKKEVLALSSLVEDRVGLAMRAVSNRDLAMAELVSKRDNEVDASEIDIEESCLKILALHQPVATDLRFIVAVLKINNDLERIGDLAVSIAKHAGHLARLGQPDLPLDLPAMSDRVRAVLRLALDSLVNLDAQAARRVLQDDDVVDDMNHRVRERVTAALGQDGAPVEALLHLLQVSRRLERIADHASNIAEDVIYMIEGDIVRHSDGA